MESRWRTYTKQVIAEADKQLPPDATQKEVQEFLRARYPFGERKYYPYEVWLSEIKRYMDRRFSTTPPDVPAISGSLWEAR